MSDLLNACQACGAKLHDYRPRDGSPIEKRCPTCRPDTDTPGADPDEGCDCDRFEGGDHTRLCASVAATAARRRAADSSGSARTDDDRARAIAWMHACGCEPDTMMLAELIAQVRLETIKACVGTVEDAYEQDRGGSWVASSMLKALRALLKGGNDAQC